MMNILPRTEKTLFTGNRRLASWASHSDPYMVVLSEQAQFLALEVVIAYLSAFRDGSRNNTFLRAHGWAKNFLSNRKGSEAAMLRGLTTYLFRNPRQAALILESEHLLIARDEREHRLRRAYDYFARRGSQHILDMIECYQNAVYLVEEERQHEAALLAARKRNQLARLKRLVARIKASKAQQNFTVVLDRMKTLLALDAKRTETVAGVDLLHWRYLVSPLE